MPSTPSIPSTSLEHSVASFYKSPTHCSPTTSCRGTACYIARYRGANAAARSTSPSDEEENRIYCLGQCFEAPAVLQENTRRPHMAVHSQQSIVLSRLRRGGARTLDTYTLMGGGKGLENALAMSPESVVRTLEASQLRGRGGAGFPVGRKWRAAASAIASQKVIIANADEGDPGAYIDRFLMEDDPHAVLEGMTIAAYAVGAQQGWIYIRAEYPQAIHRIEHAIQERGSIGLLGANALGNGKPFSIRISVGKGSYVCGEETALIHSIEHRRPEVSAKPPYVTERGLFGMPTVVNNVETLVNVPWILEHGAVAYKWIGHDRSRGTKALSLNSLFKNPGLYEVDFGVSLRWIVEELGGGLKNGAVFKGVLFGGPLAGILPAGGLDIPLDFEAMRSAGASVGHGGVVAFDQRMRILDLVHHVFEFAAYESCGKCTPCRIGCAQIAQQLAPYVNASTPDIPRGDAPRARRLIRALREASLCGFGVGLAEFAESALKHFSDELQPWL